MPNSKCAISSEREGLRTSNLIVLVHRWSTKTRITDKRRDLQGQTSRSQGHVMRVLADKSRTKSPRNTKLGRRVAQCMPTPRAIMRTSFKFKCQRSRSPGRLMLRPEVRHIFRKERPTNFNLGTQMKHEDPYHPQAL